MPVFERSEIKVWQRRERGKQLSIWLGWLVGTALFVYCWQFISDSTMWIFVWDSPRVAADIGSRMVPPAWSYMNKLWVPLWDTINIATLGTVIAIFLAVLIGGITFTGSLIACGKLAEVPWRIESRSMLRG